jgi:hypothetical protein
MLGSAEHDFGIVRIVETTITPRGVPLTRPRRVSAPLPTSCDATRRRPHSTRTTGFPDPPLSPSSVQLK